MDFLWIRWKKDEKKNKKKMEKIDEKKIRKSWKKLYNISSILGLHCKVKY